MMNACLTLRRRGVTMHGSVRGFMLLEVLVSILLFAFGVIALLGLQARSLAVTGGIQYRAEAVHYANAYVARMWAHRGTGAELKTLFETDGTEYALFKAKVMGEDGFEGIPYALKPVVNIVSHDQTLTSTSGSGITVDMSRADVAIRIQWVDKETVNKPESERIVHDYLLVTSVGFQPE